MGLDANNSTNRLRKWLVAIKGRHEKKAWESKNALPDENFVPRHRASHSAIADPQVQRTSVAGQQSLPTRHERTTYVDAVKSGGGFAYGGGGSFDMRPGYFEPSGELEPQQRPRSEQARPGVQRQTAYLDAIKTGGGFSYGGGGPFDMHPGHLAPSGELYQRDGRRVVASPQPSALKARHLEQTASSSRPKQRRASVSGATPPLSATQIPATGPQHMKSARRNSTSSPLPPGHYIHPVTQRLIPAAPKFQLCQVRSPPLAEGAVR
ncbi:hypothetical protein Tdes44962_MAKER09955 [Teratosphaeria destructans]|uniref:Uncharacterized protein n=1 Tax=Teratosphaeria destructans TaxID=418781 RepID=A0A9W7SQP8_9PEZI|nr:hypothetical protein Tdes44962_MAKER09955 [Teratosphaeria destructans]